MSCISLDRNINRRYIYHMPIKENIIHLAQVFNGRPRVLYLVKEEGCFRWYDGESPTELSAESLPEALRLAGKQYALQNFRMVHCGTKFTLPERDEHGAPATYQEMMKSLQSSNGVFQDEASGHACIVREIPLKFFR